jgi:hypothetical protein
MIDTASGSRLQVAPSVGRDSLDWILAVRLALLGGWLLGYVVLAVERPGELLEWALIGAAGAVLASQRAIYGTPALALACLAAFAAPLENVWPVRTFEVATAHVPLLPDVAGNVPSLLLVVALALPSCRRALRRAPRLLAVPAGLVVVGGLIATIFAADFRSALQAWLVGLVVPAAWGLLIAGVVRSERDAWLVLGAAVSAAVVPLFVGVAAYVLEFGVTASPNQLMRNKFFLVRPHLIQDAVLGNLAHFGDLAILVLPAAALGLSARTLAPHARLACATAVLGVSLVLVLILERVAIVLGLAGLAGLLAIAVGRRTWSAVALALAFLLVLSVAVRQPVRGYIGSAVGVGSSVVKVSGVPVPAGPSTPGVVASPGTTGGLTKDTSTEMRAGAVSEAWHLYRGHPIGLGPGQYPAYDPVHTAAHSLPVQLLAEDGPLALVGFIVLFAIVVVELLRLLRGYLTRSAAAPYLRLAALGGALLFLTEATVTGSQLAVNEINLWGLLLWLQIAIAVALARPIEARDA